MAAVNPFLPQYEHIPDGEPRIFENRVFLYGSHDKSHGTEFCTEDYVCWSAPVEDITDWRCEGTIYKKDQDPFNAGGEHAMYAPDVVQGPDGRYYLYYVLDDMCQISVAVCDRPAGKYEFYGMVSYFDKKGNRCILKDYVPFDPGVLVEGNRVFLYYGFCPLEEDPENPMLHYHDYSIVCELETDMVTVKTEPKPLIPGVGKAENTGFEKHPFFEASSIRKIGEKYYFIYSSLLSHELCYAFSRYPDREFAFGGTIISNGDIGLNGRPEKDRVAYTGNNHGSVIEIQGKWYVFYHRHTQAVRCCRQACAEKIEILADGRIPQVEITSCGLNNELLRTKGCYSSAICCNLIGGNGAFHIEGTQDFKDEIPYVEEEQGEAYVANIVSGTQIGFKYFIFHGREYGIRVRLRGNFRGQILIMQDGGTDTRLTGKAGTVIGRADISALVKEWKDLEIDILPAKGKHGLFFGFSGKGKLDFYEFEWLT